MNYLLASATVHLYVSGSEVGGGIGYSAQNWGTVTVVTDTAANVADVVFGTSTGSWGTVDEVVIKKSGVIVYRKTFTGVAIASGNTVKYAAGALSVQETLCQSAFDRVLRSQ